MFIISLCYVLNTIYFVWRNAILITGLLPSSEIQFCNSVTK